MVADGFRNELPPCFRCELPNHPKFAGIHESHFLRFPFLTFVPAPKHTTVSSIAINRVDFGAREWNRSMIVPSYYSHLLRALFCWKALNLAAVMLAMFF